MTISIHDLHQIAHNLGIEISHHTGGKIAWFSPTLKLISTHRGLTIWDYKSALAHELGHAINGDQHINHHYFNDCQERRADEYAAKLLIDHEDLHDLFLWHGNDFASLAIDLEVTPHLLEVYLNMNPLNQREIAQ